MTGEQGGERKGKEKGGGREEGVGEKGKEERKENQVASLFLPLLSHSPPFKVVGCLAANSVACCSQAPGLK